MKDRSFLIEIKNSEKLYQIHIDTAFEINDEIIETVRSVEGVGIVHATRYHLCINVGTFFKPKKISEKIAKAIVDYFKERFTNVFEGPRIELDDNGVDGCRPGEKLSPENLYYEQERKKEKPRKYSDRSETDLKGLINRAVSREDYETAAEIRDELKLRKNG